MIKKFLLTAILLILFVNPSFGLKIKNQIEMNKLYSAQIVSVDDSFNIVIKFDKMWTTVYLPNIDCKEYSRVYALKSSDGRTYLRPRSRSVRVSRDTTDYLIQVFNKYSDSIYFMPYGFGLYANMVGDLYVGKTNLRKHLIEQGYCSFVQ